MRKPWNAVIEWMKKCFLIFAFHGKTEEYRVFLENLSFPSFSKLMEAAKRTNESVHKSSRFNTTASPTKFRHATSSKEEADNHVRQRCQEG